jgi:hypothetical protein
MHQDARKGMKRPLKLAAFGSGMAAETTSQTAISSVSHSFAMPLAFLTEAIVERDG